MAEETVWWNANKAEPPGAKVQLTISDDHKVTLCVNGREVVIREADAPPSPETREVKVSKVRGSLH